MIFFLLLESEKKSELKSRTWEGFGKWVFFHDSGVYEACVNALLLLHAFHKSDESLEDV